MTSSPNLDDIRRVLDLIATPLALEVLDGLDRDIAPHQSAPPDTEPDVVDAAVDALYRVGAALSSPTASPTLTPRGRRLLAALRQASEMDHAPGNAAECLNES